VARGVEGRKVEGIEAGTEKGPGRRGQDWKRGILSWFGKQGGGGQK
jgi:hypothetical protein